MPRHFWRTVVVFRAIPAPVFGEESGFILSCTWLSSRVRRACVGPFDRAPSLGFPTSSRHQPSESTSDGHHRPAYVPPSAFRTLSTACSSPNLADLFHPAATSRLLAPGGSSPDLTGTTSSVARAFAPLAPSPAAGCPTTPESVASTSRPCSRPGSAASTEVLAPLPPVSPHALVLLRARFPSLEGAVDAPSARGLGCPALAVPRATNPQRVDRLATSMLYP